MPFIDLKMQFLRYLLRVSIVNSLEYAATKYTLPQIRLTHFKILNYTIKNKKLLLRELLVNYCSDLVTFDLYSPDTELNVIAGSCKI